MTGLRRRITALEVRRGGTFFSMSDEELEDEYATTLDLMAASGFLIPDHWRPGVHLDLRRAARELEQICEG